MLVQIVSFRLEIDAAQFLPEGIVVIEKLVSLSGIEASLPYHSHRNGYFGCYCLAGFGLV